MRPRRILIPERLLILSGLVDVLPDAGQGSHRTLVKVTPTGLLGGYRLEVSLQPF